MMKWATNHYQAGKRETNSEPKNAGVDNLGGQQKNRRPTGVEKKKKAGLAEWQKKKRKNSPQQKETQRTQ